MSDTETNHKTGPHTEEGKQISSMNALKHGLFSSRVFLLPGENQEDFDRLHYRYKREYGPKGATEEDIVYNIAQTEWRRRRVAALEADSLFKSLDAGNTEHKFIHTYGLYGQRFVRSIQSELNFLLKLQSKRKQEAAVRFRLAIVLNKYNRANNIPWNPADDGFVFSRQLLDERQSLADRIRLAGNMGTHFGSDEEIDLFMCKGIEI